MKGAAGGTRHEQLARVSSCGERDTRGVVENMESKKTVAVENERRQDVEGDTSAAEAGRGRTDVEREMDASEVNLE